MAIVPLALLKRFYKAMIPFEEAERRYLLIQRGILKVYTTNASRYQKSRRKYIRIHFRENESKCACCFILLTKSNLTIQHIIPRCFGGPPNYFNYLLFCKKCNIKDSTTISKTKEKLMALYGPLPIDVPIADKTRERRNRKKLRLRQVRVCIQEQKTQEKIRRKELIKQHLQSQPKQSNKKFDQYIYDEKLLLYIKK